MRAVLSARRVQIVVLGLTLSLLVTFGILHDDGSSPRAITKEDISRLELPHIRSSFSPKNVGDDATGRREYELIRLRDPLTGTIPTGIRALELEFVRGLPRSEDVAAKSGALMTQQWTFRGPSNVGGRTRALAVDLDYDGTSNRRILAGGISGGLYRSEDDGESWTLTTGLADLASVTCLAQDPSNRNIWYYGTGELLGNSAGGGIGAFHGQGLFKSVDSGLTWSAVSSTRDGSATAFDNLWDYVWNVAVHPSGVVLAATYGGIFKSTDGGSSWQYVLGRQQDADPFSEYTDLAIAADGDVFAALSRNGSGTTAYGVFKSTDAGTGWQDVTPPGLTTDPYRMVLGTAPSDANTLFLLVQTNQQGATAADHQLFRYDDASGSWIDLSSSIPNEQGVDGNASFSTQGGYDQLVKVKRDDPNTVFIGGTNLYRSTDGGTTFSRIGGYSTPANYSQFNNHHSDQHSLVFLPTNPNVAISGHDGGLSKSSDILASPHSWSSLNRGYVTTQFYAVAIDPLEGGTSVIGGLQDNGTWWGETEDASADWVDLFGGDGAHAAISPGATAFYVSAQNGVVYRLTNGGFAYISPAGAKDFMFINPLVLDPNDARVMYMGEAGGVWRNSNLDGIPDGGSEPTATNWTFLNASAQTGMRTSALAVSRTPADRLYFGVSDFQSQTRLIRVDNAGANGAGTDITPPVTAQGLPPYPSAIAVNPEDGDEIIAVFSNYNVQSVWHSTNGGGAWTNIDGNLGGENGPSVRTAAIVPTSAGKMYFVGTSTGLYSTNNPQSGAWALEGGDVLGNVVVDMIVARPEDGVIVAATHGRGVYQAKIGGGAGGAAAALDVSELNIGVLPGATESAEFTLTNTGSADLSFNLGAVGKTGSDITGFRLHPDADLQAPPVDRGRSAFQTGGRQPARAGADVISGRSIGSSGDVIIFDSGDEFPDDFLGWGDGTTPFQWGSRFTAPVGGFTLESFYVYMRSENAANIPLSVYITDPLGNVFISGSLDMPASTDGNAGEWYQITFDPILLPEGQQFDIELLTPAEIIYPAGVDMNGLVPNTGFFWVTSGLDGWYAELANTPGYASGAWLIRAEGTAGGTSLNQPPTASISASKSQVVVNETLSFDGSASTDPDGSIVSYAWTFGDGGTAAGSAVEHAFTATGTFTVTLTVTDNEGAAGQATKQITVISDNQPPLAQIQVSAFQAQVGEELTFNGSGSTDADGSIVAYAWAFGDGGTSSTSVAAHTYTQPGTYTVSLTVTDDEGATGRTTVQVTILDEPTRLTATPVSGVLQPGESQIIVVSYDAADQAEGSYDGVVSVVTNAGRIDLPVTILVSSSVDVEALQEIPVHFSLEQNYPNPFNPATTIRFTLRQPSNVRLVVFDANGRVVRKLLDGYQSAGEHNVTWDGANDLGYPVASGAYLYRLESRSDDGITAAPSTRKMILLR